ncbi:cytochrome P450 [Actinomadura xylanilytica]|uniref:cytochrome P450 n=1 Tax=Actinomadura xylanilytica TaxID=887459 RepID=UPI00255B36F1|nr:cytochrome P450 [Actinomadura xylanilytica]MDL4774549.1 cytochrome P450 [Actinomadura xylanilytica]
MTASSLPLSATTTCPDTAPVFERLWHDHGPVAPVELEPGVRAWLVMGYEELKTLTGTPGLFSRDARDWRAVQDGTVPPDSPLGPMMSFRDSVTGYDGDAHRRLRRPLEDAVASIDHRRLRRTVEALCADLIAAFAGRGAADLVAEYAAAVPLLTIGDLIGLDPARSRELLDAMRALFGSGADAQDGNRRFEALLRERIRSCRDDPSDDLTGVLLAHRDLHTDAEVLQSIFVLASAGNHATISWIAQTLRLMLTDPRFAGRVRGGRLGIDDALDEVLSIAPPLSNMPARYALRDTELGGRTVRRGDALILGLAAVAHDSRAHAGTTFWQRGNRAHLAWSAGPHACPARDPARIIARTAVATALHALRNLRLTIDPADVAFEPSPWTRLPVRLPVAFETTLPEPAPPVPSRPPRRAPAATPTPPQTFGRP